MKARPLAERLWEKVDFSEGVNGCWLWTATTRGGYGIIGHERHCFKAHRIVYQLVHGTIPEGMLVCHHCDVRNCVNPAHLFIGSSSDNRIDAVRKNRHYKTDGENNGNAKLTREQVLEIRKRYSTGDESISSLAKEYSITPPAMGRICKYQRWINV